MLSNEYKCVHTTTIVSLRRLTPKVPEEVATSGMRVLPARTSGDNGVRSVKVGALYSLLTSTVDLFNSLPFRK